MKYIERTDYNNIELYTNFKIFVDGYCVQNGDSNK